MIYHFTKEVDFGLTEEYRRNGEGRINTPQAGVVPSSKKFPSGVVEHTNQLKFTATYQPSANFKLDFSGEYERIKNPGNQSGKKDETLIFRTKLSLNLWKEKGF